MTTPTPSSSGPSPTGSTIPTDTQGPDQPGRHCFLFSIIYLFLWRVWGEKERPGVGVGGGGGGGGQATGGQYNKIPLLYTSKIS